jgi:hypothetical protein
MTVLLDQSGSPLDVFSHCYTISEQDGNLGDTPTADPTVNQLTYDGAAPAGTTAARLHAMVNNNFPGTILIENIVVTTLNGGIDPYSGLDVTGNGFTYVDTNTTPDVIRVVYDLSQCLGAGIATFDTSNNPITTPNPVILYHELSHAFRGVTGTNAANDEPPAITDENDLRAVLGLCMRDVNNHAGQCSGGSNCGGSDGSGGGCFIVTATTGSPESAEIVELRRLRDGVAAESRLGARLIEAIYTEYARFSPAIADGLAQDTTAREAVLRIAVRPLLAWYALAGLLASEAPDSARVHRAAKALRSACPRYLAVLPIAEYLDRIRAGRPLPAAAPGFLREFEPRIRQGARLRFASWAILDPLTAAWAPSSGDADVVGRVVEWLAAAPLEALAPPSDAEGVAREMAGLERLLSRQPSLYARLRERLDLAWRPAAGMHDPHGPARKDGAR